MTRLSRYLLRLFASETAALFGVATFLLFLVQCLKLFDVVTVRGQSLWTLIGQALLGMPGLVLVFLYVCFGIGLGRSLRGLGDRNELQIIHASALLPALLRSIALYGIVGTLLTAGFGHVIDPLSVRASNEWSASIAADLVSRSMIPRRFTKVRDGVSMIIGSRDADGRITDFFVDLDGEGMHRTYFADSAIITRDETGYVLRMRSGGMQQMTADKRFSEISFASYDLALDQLTGDFAPGNRLAQMPSYEFVGAPLDAATQRTLVNRSTEALRVIAMVLFVAALAAFPSGRRGGPRVPIELAVMGAVIVERGVASYLPAPAPWGGVSGPLLLAAVGALVLLARLHPVSGLLLRRRRA